jgi:uncharacterized protein
VGDLVLQTLFQRDLLAALGLVVDRRLRNRDHERNAGLARRERQGIRPDLVGHIAVRRHAVGSHDDGVRHPPADEERPGTVADQVVLDAELAQLPAGQPRPLQQRAGLVHDDVAERTLVVQRPDHAQRRSPAQAGEAPGVAVRMDGQRACSADLGQVARAALADTPAHADRGVPDGAGRGFDGRRAARDRGGRRDHFPAQVDGGRAGVADPLDLGVDARGVPAFAFRLPDRERDTQRARDPEERGTADSEPGNRVDQLVDRGDVQHADLMRERRLVDRDDMPVPPGDHVAERVRLRWITSHTVEPTPCRESPLARQNGQMRTIAVEEHFWTPELAAPPGSGVLALGGQDLDDRLRDLDERRLAEMDAAGIDVQVISHVQPAAQGLPGTDGIVAARRANDYLAAAVARHPERFAGFATLPTASPEAAAGELERTVGDLGFVGGLVNSTLGSNGAFLDDPRFEPLLSRFEELDVPLYLHPAPPPSPVHEVLFGGLPKAVAGRLATGAWGWHAEAGLHALRMVVAGVFDRHPGLRLIIGHCGEMLPFMLARIDQMTPPSLTGLAAPLSEYFLRHVWVTTSGMFSLPPVLCTIEVFGVDRVLFSVDYPFSGNAAGRALLDALPLSPADKAKIASLNAERVLGLA